MSNKYKVIDKYYRAKEVQGTSTGTADGELYVYDTVSQVRGQDSYSIKIPVLIMAPGTWVSVEMVNESNS